MNCTYYTRKKFILIFKNDDLRSVRKGKQKLSFSSLLLGTAKKLRLSFFHSRLVTENLPNIHKTFTLTYPSVNKSKFKVHPRNIVIVKRFCIDQM